MVCLIRISFLIAFCRCDQVLLEPGHTCQQFASCVYEHIFLHKIISRNLIISGVFTPLQKFMHCSPFPLMQWGAHFKNRFLLKVSLFYLYTCNTKLYGINKNMMGAKCTHISTKETFCAETEIWVSYQIESAPHWILLPEPLCFWDLITFGNSKKLVTLKW